MASGFSEGGGRSVRVRDRDVTTEAEMWDEGDKRRHGARCGRGGEARGRGAQRPADPADAGPGRERTPPAGRGGSRPSSSGALGPLTSRTRKLESRVACSHSACGYWSRQRRGGGPVHILADFWGRPSRRCSPFLGV